MLHGLMSMLDSDVLDLDYITAVIELNDKMISEKQQVLKSHRMKELQRCHGIMVHQVRSWG